ncbi:MAG TPA: aspartyl/asparaginyl beta-hydroxylase domain-containing protein [Allosphingosinicella sp.]|nr:aspartyl/asparaginyl beta-hydroxylase domain-containing protein [Allosphingosinicella sp.]
MRRRIDRVIARSSLVPNDPILASTDFSWTRMLEDNWTVIRDEAAALLPRIEEVPSLRSVSPDHRRIAPTDLWKSFFLYGYGYRLDDNCLRCPRTAALAAQIPGLNSAFFSILLPGMHIESHRGPTKGLLTCHLGLMVPQGCRMMVDDRMVGWREGECLIWDDTYRHEVWHEGDSPRVILLVQVKRPLRAPGKQVAELFLAGIRRSPFVQEGRRNMAAWDRAMKVGERDD